MTAQPAELEPRDAGPVRILHVVPDPPRTSPRPPEPPAQPAVETPLRPFDRVAVIVLAMPVGSVFVAWTGSLPVLVAWAVVWVVLVAWTAWGFRD